MMHWCLFSITENTFRQLIVDFSEYKICICFWLLSRCYRINEQKRRVCRPPPSLDDLKSIRVILSSMSSSSSIPFRSHEFFFIITDFRYVWNIDFAFFPFMRIAVRYKIHERAYHPYHGFGLRSNHSSLRRLIIAEQVAIANDADSIVSRSRITTMFFAIILGISTRDHPSLRCSLKQLHGIISVPKD